MIQRTLISFLKKFYSFFYLFVLKNYKFNIINESFSDKFTLIVKSFKKKV